MRLEKLTVADLMTTALITVGPHEMVERADLDMSLAGIRHIPVVDERNHLIGIISDRDLVRAFGLSRRKKVEVSEVMTTDLQTMPEHAPAADAVETMIEYKIGCLPVLGDEGQLVGLVTETDFLQVAFDALTSARQLGR